MRKRFAKIGRVHRALRRKSARGFAAFFRTLESHHLLRAAITIALILLPLLALTLDHAFPGYVELLLRHSFFLLIRYGYVGIVWLLIALAASVLLVEWRGIWMLRRVDDTDLCSLERAHPYLPSRRFILLCVLLTLALPFLLLAAARQTRAALSVPEEPYVYTEARSWQIANDDLSLTLWAKKRKITISNANVDENLLVKSKPSGSAGETSPGSTVPARYTV